MKQPTFPVTPALLVCAAFPLLFLLAPDGIPCVHAGCGAAATGTVTNLGVITCRGCSAVLDSGENIGLQNCSVSKTIGKCEITASLDVVIQGQCDVVWHKWCFADFTNPECSISVALTGPSYPFYTNISTTHGCTSDNELMTIELRPSVGELGSQVCLCEPLGFNPEPGEDIWVVYSSSGVCDLP